MVDNREWMDQIFQIVMVVENLDETLNNWKEMVEFDESSIKFGDNSQAEKCLYKGEPIDCKVKYVIFNLGGVEMKLVEPQNKEGGDPYSDSLLKCGPGIHHLGFYSKNYNDFMKAKADSGKTPVYEEVAGDSHYYLYDFSEKTGLMISPWDHMEGPCAR